MKRPIYGVLISYFRGQYQLELMRGIEHEARKRDVSVITLAGRCIHSPLPSDAEQNSIYDIIAPEHLDGIIISSLIANYARRSETDSFVKRFLSVPAVTINFDTPDAHSLQADSIPGFTALLEHLIVDHGFSKIAYIGGPSVNPDAMVRLSIFRDVLARFGQRNDAKLVTEGDFSYSTGRLAVKTLLDDRGIAPRRIEAIVAANDLMALGAITELAARSIRVPEDIAVTGFDDIIDARTSSPPLTTVRQPAFEIGKRAIAILAEQGREKSVTTLDTTLIIRSSCGCPASRSSVRQASPKKSSSLPANASPVSEHYIYEIIYSSDALRESRTFDELITWMKLNLSPLGITGALLFLYEEPGNGEKRFSLAPGFGQNGRSRAPAPKPFNASSFTREMSGSTVRFSRCALPLVSGGCQFGFLLLDVNIDAWIAYESIRSQISSCLSGISLLDELGIANRELKNANKKLKAADEQKTRFFINIAHDTKTPLTLIKNYLEKYILAHSSDPDLGVVKQNIDILLSNMINLLDAKKLEQGRFEYDHDRITDLSGLCENKIDLFRIIAKKRGISIVRRLEPGILVKADPRAIDRVLDNLIDNAIKYGRERGEICVALSVRAGRVSLSISDDGPGIDPALLKHLGKPYHQLSHEKSGRQGIGMGLFIVRKILETLGATLRIESRINVRTSFTIELNRTPGTMKDSGKAAFVPAEPPDGIVPLGPVRETGLSKNKRTILVIDDNRAMLEFLRNSLSIEYNVFMSESGAEALSRLGSIPIPDAIISDVMMDGLDGHGLLNALAHDNRYRGIPFIFLTAKHDEADRITGLSEGAVDYIAKPFSIDELLNKIRALVSLGERQRENEAEKLKKDIIGFLSEGTQNPHDHDYYRIEEIFMKLRLSIREQEVARLMLEGRTNKEIASRLNFTVRTAEFHVANIYRKLEVKDRFGLYERLRDK